MQSKHPDFLMSMRSEWISSRTLPCDAFPVADLIPRKWLWCTWSPIWFASEVWPWSLPCSRDRFETIDWNALASAAELQKELWKKCLDLIPIDVDVMLSETYIVIILASMDCTWTLWWRWNRTQNWIKLSMHHCLCLGKCHQQPDPRKMSCKFVVSCNSALWNRNHLEHKSTTISQIHLPNLSTFVSFFSCKVYRIAASLMSELLNALDLYLLRMSWSSSRLNRPTTNSSPSPSHFSFRWHRLATNGNIVHYRLKKSFCLRIRNRIRRWPHQSLRKSFFSKLFHMFTSYVCCAVIGFVYYSLKSTGLYVIGQFSPMLCVYGTILDPLPWYTHWPSANM